MCCAAERGEAECAGRGTGNGVPTEQGHAVVGEDIAQSFGKTRIAIAKHISEQHTYWLGTLGRKIGKIGGDQLPSKISGIRAGKGVNAFDYGIVRQYQRFAADFEHGCVVSQPASGRMRGKRAKAGDEI